MLTVGDSMAISLTNDDSSSLEFVNAAADVFGPRNAFNSIFAIPNGKLKVAIGGFSNMLTHWLSLNEWRCQLSIAVSIDSLACLLQVPFLK